MNAPDLESLLTQWRDSDGSGARVALLDSGVDRTHPWLASGPPIETLRMAPQRDGSFLSEADSDGDVAGHGTACAARIRQIAPTAEILSLRVLNPSIRTTSGALLAALEWLCSVEHLSVVSLSLGTPNREFGLEIAHCVDRLYARGVPVVASAGPGGWPDYPAVFASPVSVTSDALATTLNDLFFRPGDLVEFAAQGDHAEIAWLDGRVVTASGSSFAVPLVAGRLARFKGIAPQLRVWELKTLLQRQAKPADQTL